MEFSSATKGRVLPKKVERFCSGIFLKCCRQYFHVQTQLPALRESWDHSESQLFSVLLHRLPRQS